MELENITIQQYFDMSVEDRIQYDIILSSLRQRNQFNDRIFDPSGLSYSEVKFSYKLMASCNDSLDSICKLYETVFKISKTEFLDSSVVELFSTQKHVVETFTKMYEREMNLLRPSSTENQAIWEAAGGAKLVPFNAVLPLIELGKYFGMYPHDLQHKNYEEILVLLAAIKTQNEVEREFNKLKSKIK